MSTRDDLSSGTPGAAGVADEVRAIITATMRLADAIREDAERRAEERLRAADDEARRRLESARREAEEIAHAERRRADILERVVERSETASAELAAVRHARRHLDDALTSLAAAVEGISRTAGVDDEAPPTGAAGSRRREGSEPAFLQAPDEARAEGADVPRAGEPPPQSDHVRGASAARLVASQMALAGSTRAEVTAHLQRGFDLPAVHEVLDEVFDDREPRIPSARDGEAR